MIETKRLTLRPFRQSDLDAYVAIRARPTNARFLPGGEAGATDAADRAPSIMTAWGEAAWTGSGFAPWAVIEKSSARLIGHLGLRHLPEINETELLYLIDEPFRGRGLATEGGRAAIEFARTRLRIRLLVAFILPHNTASISVIRKLGFRDDGKQAIFGLQALRFRLDIDT